jgi:Ca2+-binding EF-hand superfamily protein
MIGRCLQIAIFIPLLATALNADDPRDPPPSDGPTTLNRDILYFYRDYPVFIRVRIEVDGASFADVWVEYLQSLFEEVDSNGDGRLTAAESAMKSKSGDGISADALRLVRDPDLWSADRSPFDQAISMDELTTFLIASQRGPLQAPETAPAPVSSDAVGEMLFQLLDIDANRGLTENELAQAMTSLHRRDLDDDGTISVAELSATSNPFRSRVAAAPTAGTRPFVTLIPGTASIDVVREIERRYATTSSVTPGSRGTRSRALQRSDLGIEPEAFARYDFDSDGHLDRDELRELIRNPPPTLELVVRLGAREADEHIVELIGSAHSEGEQRDKQGTRTPERNISVRRSTDGLTSIVINDVQIEIAEVVSGPDVAKQYLLRQFSGADRDRNGYLDEDESSRNNAFRLSFDQFDVDGDGKLFKKELTDVVDGRTRAARSRTRMTVRNRGRDLFEILDVDRNRSLGRRELAQAVKRVELWDTDDDGVISESEIPQLYQISFGPGQPQFRGVQIPGQTARMRGNDNATNPVAPRWFTKLDRNGDGELARREFPGSRVEFQKLDQNSDGIVDAAEAEFVK